ncbi:MAG: hypothetical protein MZV64_21585 [Ignavibacteriales bacterium]|nr:hypothetical protein [Ignavibacteriales bacterium]
MITISSGKTILSAFKLACSVNQNSLLLSSSINYIDYQFKSILNQNAKSVNSTGYYSLSKLRDIYAKFNAEVNWHSDHTMKIGTELALHNYDLIYNDYYDELIEKNLYSQPDLISTEAALFLQKRMADFSSAKNKYWRKSILLQKQKVS